MSTPACSLPTAERPIRQTEFDSLFTSSARSVSRDERGVRIFLKGEPGLRERVRELTDRESRCCSFFTFLIEGTDQDLTLSISVPSERQAILDALAARAEDLSREIST